MKGSKKYSCALYCRLSKEYDIQGESQSIKNQKELLKRYAKENKLKIHDVYIDDGYSGTNFDRPDFQRMIRDIEKWLTIDYQVIDDINNMLFDKKRQVFKSAKFAVCMRFHSVVFSLYSGIPFCAISYSPKTTNILSEYGLENSFVEYGITSSQFFYREFDLDFDKFKHLIDEQLSSTELARLGYLKKELRKKGKQQENLLVKWIGGRI